MLLERLQWWAGGLLFDGREHGVSLGLFLLGEQLTVDAHDGVTIRGA